MVYYVSNVLSIDDIIALNNQLSNRGGFDKILSTMLGINASQLITIMELSFSEAKDKLELLTKIRTLEQKLSGPKYKNKTFMHLDSMSLSGIRLRYKSIEGKTNDYFNLGGVSYFEGMSFKELPQDLQIL